ncbi:MAG: NlpC/P60 family protein [Actinobacteria bacterium]|nr:NlpC/P60 family protein [Actinomycetota bacterium]
MVSTTFAGADPAGDIAAKQTQAESVKSQIASLNGELEAKVESYNEANIQLAQINDRITDNQAKLDAAIVQLGEMQDRLEQRVVKIYRNGDVNVLDVLMDTSDLNEFLTKYDMLTKVGEQDRDDLEQVKMLKDQVEEAKVQLASDQSTQSGLVDSLASEKADIEAGLGQRQQMLSGIEGEISQLQAQQQAQQAAALAAQQQAAAADNSGGGGGDVGGRVGPLNPSTAGGVVGIAMQYLGVPYVWGGASPSGFDCSGLVMYVYAQVGISLPHGATAQYAAGTPISYDELQPGDLVFFGSGGGYMSHVGIYIGGGSMIHAPFEGTVVQIGSVSSGGTFRGAARF